MRHGRLMAYTGSPWLMALIVFILTSVYVGTSFGGATYWPFMDFLLKSWPGLVLIALLAINQTAWSVRLVLKRRQPLAAEMDAIKAMDVHEHLPPDSPMKDTAQFARWLRAQGYAPVETSGSLWARRGRASILPGMVLRAGIALSLIALVASVYFVAAGQVLLTSGQKARVLGQEVQAISIDPGMPAEFLQAGTNVRGGFTLDDIKVTLRSGGREFTATGGYPVRISGLYYRIIHLGYAQPANTVRGQDILMLDVLPPGSVSTHEIGGTGAYEFRLAPERTVKKGLVSGGLYDLHTPRYAINPRGGKSEAVVARSGEGFFKLQGMRITLGQAGLYVRLSVVDYPAMPLLKLGLRAMALGLLMMFVRLGWYERRFAATMHEGRLLVGYSEEFYGKWGVFKFRRWMSAPPFTS